MLPLKPSDYVRRQVWVTFQDDVVAPMTTEFLREDNYMWASDFAYPDSTWPNSRQVVEREFKGLTNDVKNKIVFNNAVTLYGMDL